MHIYEKNKNVECVFTPYSFGTQISSKIQNPWGQNQALSLKRVGHGRSIQLYSYLGGGVPILEERQGEYYAPYIRSHVLFQACLYSCLINFSPLPSCDSEDPPCRPQSSVSNSLPLAKDADPPPPSLYTRSFSQLPSPHLHLRSALRYPATVRNNEPSLAACIQLAPTNSWRAAPDYA